MNKQKQSQFRLNHILTIAFLLSLVAFIVFFNFDDDSFEIQYEQYVVKHDDALFEIVQEINSYNPRGWDANDFVYLTLERNQINKPTDLKAGQIIYIAVAKQKE